jgi:hypothetical protein
MLLHTSILSMLIDNTLLSRADTKLGATELKCKALCPEHRSTRSKVTASPIDDVGGWKAFEGATTAILPDAICIKLFIGPRPLSSLPSFTASALFAVGYLQRSLPPTAHISDPKIAAARICI